MESRGSSAASQNKPPAKKWSLPWHGPSVSHPHLLGVCPLWVEASAEGMPHLQVLPGKKRPLGGYGSYSRVVGMSPAIARGTAALAHHCWPWLSPSEVLTSFWQVRQAAMCWCRSCGRRSVSCCRWSAPWSPWPSVGSMPVMCSLSCGGRAPVWPSDPPQRVLPKLLRGRSSGPACP